ncbi:MAG TPA: ZIP family metal transporter [Candidatus Saccharimonadales bacterium]|nr:ZIP family metal transporter [Candidatus Saccharimonadales bacterium]
MTPEAILVSLGAFISAMSGGWLALRAVRYVAVIIAIGAGIRIGAAFVDLIPEAIELLGSLDAAMFWTTVGFVGFYVIDKLTTLHVGHETSAELDHEHEHHQHIGMVGATGMGIHSLLDGVALAAGLAAGGSIGLIIAVVVIVHRFSDGIGVVSFLLASNMPSSIAMRWVAVVAAAPLLGVFIGSLILVPDEMLGAMLGFFAGFFLYVGAAELLPEAHRRDRSRYIVLATLSGVVLIYAFSYLVGAIGADVH